MTSRKQRLLSACLLAFFSGCPGTASPVFLPVQPEGEAFGNKSASVSVNDLVGQPVISPVSNGQFPSFLTNNATMTTSNSSLLNGGYWPQWKGPVDETCVAVDALTDVNIAFASIADDGSLVLNNDEALQSWLLQKQASPKLRINVAVGGGRASATASFAAMVASPGKMHQFTQSARAVMEQYSLNGIDIDWEYPNNQEQGQQFLALMTQLRQALPKPYRISTALPAGAWVLKHIPLEALSEQLDILNLMAYDFAGPNFGSTTATAHQAKLFTTPESGGSSGASAVDYITKRGFPANKIMLGIPLYGRGFAGAGWVGQSFSKGGKNGEYEVKNLPLAGMEEFYDTQAVAVFAVGNGEFITYDDKHSVAEKAKFARAQGLAGLFYWQIGGDRCGPGSLIRAGFDSLNSNETVTTNSRVSRRTDRFIRLN